MHDEFSYLLGADTLLHRRFSNPTPPLAEHFETMHVLMWPSYASKYPIGQPASLALGRMLFGHPFWGVVVVIAAAGATAAWATRAWAGPLWGLISGIQVALVFGMNHYWARSYWGGGLAFLGSMLVIGGYRVLSAYRKRSGAWPLAGGSVLLFFTRPYEGAVLDVCVAIALLYGAARDCEARRLLKQAVIPVTVAVLVPALLVQARVNYSVTGNLLTLPYTEHSRQYLKVPLFWFAQPDLSQKRGSGALSKQRDWDFQIYQDRVRGSMLTKMFSPVTTLYDLLHRTLSIPPALLVALCALFIDRLPWFLVGTAVATACSLLAETFFLDHYAAPFVAVVWVLQFYVLRQLAGVTRRPRLTIAVLLFVFLSNYQPIADAARLAKSAVTRRQVELPTREPVERMLRTMGGRHLVIVRRAPEYNQHREWVYNEADIGNARIIWARDLGDALNARLFARFPDRAFWLCEQETAESGQVASAMTRIGDAHTLGP